MKTELTMHRILTTILIVGVAVLGGMVYKGESASVTASVNQNTEPKKAEQAEVKTENAPVAVAVSEIEEAMKVALSSGEEIVEYGGKSWVGYPGKPVVMTILNDPACGQPCSTAESIPQLKQILTPAMITKNVDVNSEEGKALAEKFSIKQVPAYIADENVLETAVAKANPNALKSENGMVLIPNASFNLPNGKFIATPEFADTDSEPKLGNKGVQVVEFTAFECGYCGRFFNGAKAKINELVAAGKLEFIIKDFPLRNPDMHIASNCGGEQGKYWEMHDEFMGDQGKWNRDSDFGAGYARNFAEGLDLDMEKYDACVANPEMKSEIAADQAEGRTYGVRGTPALMIGSQFVPGAISAEQFEQYVNEEYAKLK